MSYTKTTWTDNVTPISAANMNKIEAGIFDHLADNSAHGGYIAYPGSTADGTDANTYDWLTGYYSVGQNMANMPTTGAYWQVQAYKNSSTSRAIVAYSSSDKISFYVRVMASGVWGAWQKLLNPTDFATQVEASLGANASKLVTPVTLRGITLPTITPSENLRASADTVLTVAIESIYKKQKAFTIATTGTYRIKFTLNNGSLVIIYGKIYKNGVDYGAGRSTQTGLTTFSEDLAFNAGDTCELWVRSTGDSGNTGSVSNFRVYFDVAYSLNLTITPNVPTLTYGS